MFRASFLFIICALAAAETTARAGFSIVRLDGTGPVRVGMNLSELNKALNTTFTKPTDPDEQACTYVEVPNQPGLGLMLLDGRFARVDVDHNASFHTAEGIHIGDSETHALQVYGKRLEVEPHFYDPNGHYLTMLSKDRKHGIRFETEEGKITRYYAGPAEAISFVEGCS